MTIPTGVIRPNPVMAGPGWLISPALTSGWAIVSIIGIIMVTTIPCATPVRTASNTAVDDDDGAIA